MKVLKGYILLVVLVYVLFSIGAVSAELVTAEIALDSVQVMVNRTAIQETNILYQNTTYVPLRAVFETLGCTVDYDADTQTASITGEVRKTQELVKRYSTYEEEYEALNAQYEILIAHQLQAGKEAEVTKLEKELADKAASLKEKYNTTTPAFELQQQEVEFNAIKVVVNGTPIDKENILFNSRTFVPLRAISESIGCEVEWVESSRTAYIWGEFVPHSERVVVYTSYEEEYAELKARYDKLIAEQLDYEKQISELTNIDDAVTEEEGAPRLQLSDEDIQKYINEAERLKRDFEDKVEKLKIKYDISE